MEKWHERFWSKVDKSGPTGAHRPDLGPCWQWVGGLHQAGYAQFVLDQYPHLGHRVSYEMSKGPIPKGLVLDHLCRNRSCVNPGHLEAKTIGQNTLAPGSLSQSALHAGKTHCPQGHEYSPTNTLRNRGRRRCLACSKAQKRLTRRTAGIPFRHNRDEITHCPQGHPYTPGNTGAHRNSRYCRTCNRDRSREYQRAKSRRLGKK